MDFHIPLPAFYQDRKLHHQDKIMLLGSCFTEHMGSRLEKFKFNTCSNPHGILFNPLSIVESLRQYLEARAIEEEDLFQWNEIWNSWDFHSRYAAIDRQRAVQDMNGSVRQAAAFLRDADWLMITLGSAFQYFLKPGSIFNNRDEIAVANCHRAPANCFEKKLLQIPEIIESFDSVFRQIKAVNPGIRVLFTVSPVRHVRDGLIENNRSKARLLEVVHHFAGQYDFCTYFPAYEIVIDVLRDYRFYDKDMVHPNHQATQFVWEQFAQNFFEAETQKLMAELHDISIAFSHKPRFAETEAHRHFKKSYLQKVLRLKRERPYINLEKELEYFGEGEPPD